MQSTQLRLVKGNMPTNSGPQAKPWRQYCDAMRCARFQPIVNWMMALFMRVRP